MQDSIPRGATGAATLRELHANVGRHHMRHMCGTRKGIQMTEKQRSFMALLMRSPELEGGYRNVSKKLTPLVQTFIADAPELYESETIDGQLRVRLSAAGETVWKYR